MTEPRTRLGVVLAGGQSRRMGQDKAQLTVGGRSLLRLAVDLLQAAGLADVVVSGEREGYQCVADVRPGGGPLVGLFSVMQAFQNHRLLVLPVDMPLLDDSLVRNLLGAEPEADSAHYVGSILPLRIDAAPSVIAAAQAQLASHDTSQHSLRCLMRRLQCRELPLPPDAQRSQLRSCNTPEQWQDIAS